MKTKILILALSILPVLTFADQSPISKDVVAVMRFESSTVRNDMLDSFTESLIKAFVSDGRFTVVERDKLTAILNEMKLQLSGITSDKDIVEIGKMVNAHYMVCGNIVYSAEYHDRKYVEQYKVTARLVDIEKGTVLSSYSTDTANLMTYSESVMKMIVSQLAYSLSRKIEGRIVNVSGNEVFTDLGQEYLKEGFLLKVEREGKGILNNKGETIYQEKDPIGRLKVISIQSKGSKCLVLDSTSKTFAEGDKVFLSVKDYDKGFGAAWRSAVLPGWGQLYNDQPEKAFIPPVSVAGGIVIYLILDDAYRKGLVTDGRPAAESDKYWGLAIAIGGYLYGVIDALITGSSLHYYEPEMADYKSKSQPAFHMGCNQGQALTIVCNIKF